MWAGPSIPRLHSTITTSQTLTPHDITSTRWRLNLMLRSVSPRNSELGRRVGELPPTRRSVIPSSEIITERSMRHFRIGKLRRVFHLYFTDRDERHCDVLGRNVFQTNSKLCFVKSTETFQIFGASSSSNGGLINRRLFSTSGKYFTKLLQKLLTQKTLGVSVTGRFLDV